MSRRPRGDPVPVPTPDTSRAWWDELGDDELLRRLVQRGVHLEIARRLVARRDRDQAARTRIAETLRR